MANRIYPAAVGITLGVAAITSLSPATLAASFTSQDPSLQIIFQPTILAGSPSTGFPGILGDSPENQVDQNIFTSPFAGVGSLDIGGAFLLWV
jgi:hypothetical protein